MTLAVNQTGVVVRHDVVPTVDAVDLASDRATQLEAFVQRDARRLVGALTLITGSRAAAEDALQDALVKAWHRRDQHFESLTAWITVVAANHARSARRRQRVERNALDALRRAAPVSSSVTAGVVSTDDELIAALAALPRRERQVAVMHYALDLSVTEVAHALGISDGTVKTLLSRARSHLAGHLGVQKDSSAHEIGDSDDHR